MAILGVASALGLAVPAHADPGIDVSFVDALHKAGITFKDSDSAVNAGKTACDLMDKGSSEVDVIALVMQQNTGISNISAAKFTAIAASAYCPQHLHQLGSASPPPTPPNQVGGSGGQQ